MKKYTLILFSSVILLATAVACARLGAGNATAQTSKKPNFVFILVDDLGWTDVGAFGSRSDGPTFYETPNIDALAKKGVKFTNAYAGLPGLFADPRQYHDGQIPRPNAHYRLVWRTAARRR